MKTIQKPWHPPHTLIDKSEQELNALVEAEEIDEGDVAMARWRKAMVNAHTGDVHIKRYREIKMNQQKAEQQKAAAETQTAK